MAGIRVPVLSRGIFDQAHIPKERGGVDVAGIRVSVLSRGIFDQAHIPKERGGVPCRVVACS